MALLIGNWGYNPSYRGYNPIYTFYNWQGAILQDEKSVWEVSRKRRDFRDDVSGFHVPMDGKAFFTF